VARAKWTVDLRVPPRRDARVEELISRYEKFDRDFRVRRISPLKRAVCTKHRISRERFDAAFLALAWRENFDVYTGDYYSELSLYRRPGDPGYSAGRASRFWAWILGRR